MRLFLCFLAAFCAGSFPTAYLAGKYFGNIDIRRHGSGNVGATNAFRVLGKKIGGVVFLIDFLKGYLPALFLSSVLAPAMPRGEAALLVGLAAILGHIFTPFLKFRGGKGIATGSGVLCAGYPILFFLTAAIWVLSFCLSRIVSLSSLLSLGSLVVLSLFFPESRPVSWLFFLIFILLAWTHRQNLDRLIRGQEKKIG